MSVSTSDTSSESYSWRGFDERRFSNISSFEPPSVATLSWKQLSCTFTKKKMTWKGGLVVSESRPILRPQNGKIEGGTLTALMGPSGAGKSTLLKCITGRILGKNVHGSVSVTRDSSIAFVPQQDDLFPVFTVRETLLFASKVKVTAKFTDHEVNVTQILRWLDLENCADVKIGRCSGGQLKRACIGVELVSKPNILVLDEPTTGLDSSTALQCVQILKKLASSNENPPAIIATIHQPSNRILEQFNKIYLLSALGSNIYFGGPFDLQDHFAKFSLKCPKFCNPIDFAIEVAYGEHGIHCFEPMANFASSVHKYNESSTSGYQDVAEVIEKARKKKMPLIKQTVLLMKRNWINVFKSSNQFWFQFLLNIATALLISNIFDYGVGSNDGCWSTFTLNLNEKELKANFFKANLTQVDDYLTKIGRSSDATNFLFFVTSYITSSCMALCVLPFASEANVICKEMSNRWYSVVAYFWAKLLSDLPTHLINNLVFCILVYFLSGQVMELRRFLLFFFIISITSEICTTFGMTIGIMLSRDLKSALLCIAPAVLISVFFSGALVRLSAMPWFYKMLSYLSFLRYGCEALLVIMYGFDRCSFQGSDKTVALIETVTSPDAKPTHIMTEVLTYLNITKNDSYHFGEVLNVEGVCIENIINSMYAYFGGGRVSSAVASSSFSDEGFGDDGDYADEVLISSETQLSGKLETKDQPSFILSYYELNDEMIHFNVYCLIAMLVIAKLSTFVVLYWRTRRIK